MYILCIKIRIKKKCNHLFNAADIKVKPEPNTEQTDTSSPKKSKILVQPTDRKGVAENEPQRANVANGQQPKQTAKDQSNDFVLTPDYIQQS